MTSGVPDGLLESRRQDPGVRVDHPLIQSHHDRQEMLQLPLCLECPSNERVPTYGLFLIHRNLLSADKPGKPGTLSITDVVAAHYDPSSLASFFSTAILICVMLG